jgi:hypothetical protein
LQGRPQPLDLIQKIQSQGGAWRVQPEILGQPSGHLDTRHFVTGETPMIWIFTGRLHHVLHHQFNHLAALQAADSAQALEVIFDPFVQDLAGQDLLTASHGYTPRCFRGFMGISSRMRS